MWHSGGFCWLRPTLVVPFTCAHLMQVLPRLMKLVPNFKEDIVVLNTGCVFCWLLLFLARVASTHWRPR